MKKKILFISLSLVLISIITFHFHSSGKGDLPNLMLENVEALAAGESGGGYCWGSGSVDCPLTHVKVRFVVED